MSVGLENSTEDRCLRRLVGRSGWFSCSERKCKYDYATNRLAEFKKCELESEGYYTPSCTMHSFIDSIIVYWVKEFTNIIRSECENSSCLLRWIYVWHFRYVVSTNIDHMDMDIFILLRVDLMSLRKTILKWNVNIFDVHLLVRFEIWNQRDIRLYKSRDIIHNRYMVINNYNDCKSRIFRIH